MYCVHLVVFLLFMLSHLLALSVSWYEGVVTEKNRKDETMLTVHITGVFNSSNPVSLHACFDSKQ